MDEQRVVVGQGVDEVEDFAAAGVAEVSDQPEVDEGDAAVVVDEDVARMGVGMEKPCRSIMVKRVSVIRPASPLRKVGHGVEVGVFQERAADVVLYEDVPVGNVGIDGWDADQRVV